MIRSALLVVSLFAAVSLTQAQTKTQNQVPFIPQTEISNQVLNGMQMANEQSRQGGTAQRDPSQKDIEKGKLFRVVYCQQNPSSTVTFPNGERITCGEEFARVKAFCTINDPGFKKLGSCKAFAMAPVLPAVSVPATNPGLASAPAPVVIAPSPVVIPAPINCTSHTYPWGTTTTNCY